MKLPQTGKHSSIRSSIYSCSSSGPAFGGGHDISIKNHASSNTNSYTNLGYTFSPPFGHSYGSSFTKSFLAGSYNFRPDEVEVFYESTWNKTNWSNDDIQNSYLDLFTNNPDRRFCQGYLMVKATNWDKLEQISLGCTKLSIILWFQNTESSHYLQIDQLYLTIGPLSLIRCMQPIAAWWSRRVLWNYLKQKNSFLLTIETGLPMGYGHKDKKQIRLGNSSKLFNYVYVHYHF